jgi:heme exporter protein A
MTQWGQELCLSADHVTVARGGFDVLRDLSFSAPAGTALLLLGPNGSGKTSLLRAVAGLLPLERGTLQLHGHDGENRPIGERCHFIGHLAGVNGRLTLRENIAFWATYLREAEAPAPDAIDMALEKTGLLPLAHLSTDILSAGQRRRLALARLFVAPRCLWLLDEPTTALDARSATQLLRAIDAHTAAGGIAMIATHQPLALARSADLDLGAMSPSRASDDRVSDRGTQD